MSEPDPNDLDPNKLAMWDVEALPDALDDRIMAALQAEEVAQAPAGQPSRRWPWLVAGIATAATLALAWGLRPGVGPRSGEVVVSATPRTVAITDRARATVDVGGELRWQADGAAISVEQASGRVRYQVDPGGPFTVTTPVATVEVTGTVFTVDVQTVEAQTMATNSTKSTRSSRSPRLMALGAALAGATGLAFVAVDEGDVQVHNEHGSTAVSRGQSAVASDVSAPTLNDDAPPPPQAEASPQTHAAAPPPTPATAPDRAKRDAALAKIQKAIATRKTHAEPTPPDDEDSPLRATVKGSLTKDYIREVVREDVVPLARDCYNSVLEDDPEFAGKLVLDFEILGDESVGGIVDNVQPGEGTTMVHGGFVECMSESMMSVVFDPPEGGGQVNISYPFVFEPG